MKASSMVAIGFVSVLGVVGMVNASDSVASEMTQPGLTEVRVGHGGSIYYRAGQVSGCNVAVAEQNRGELVEERVGHGGSIYSKASQVSGCNVVVAEQNKGELVEERIGHGGSIYSRRATTQTSDCNVNCGKTIDFYSARAAQ